MIAALRDTGVHVGKRAGRFIRWWSGELAALVPAALRRPFGRRRTSVVLEVGDEEIVVTRRTAEAAQELLRLDRRGSDAEAQRLALRSLDLGKATSGDIVLRLPMSQALWKTLELPAAAAANMHEVLHFELDRQTPYAPEQVCFDHWLRERQPAEGRLRVDLVVVPRDRVDDAVAQARDWGLPPDRVDVAAEGATDGLPINLLPEAAEETARPRSRLNAALAVLAAGLLAAAVWIPLQRQQQAATDLGQQLEAAKREAAAASRLREEIARLAEDEGFLAEKRQAAPPVVEVLDELTRLIPDESWLSEVHVKDGEGRVLGYSPAASTMIGLIEGSPLFQEVRFRSPVTQVRGSDEERFDLSFEIAAGSAK